VDGAAIGGGAEVAMAFALDPDSIVIATERTSYTFPEVSLGIYPGLGGTLTLPRIIYKATGDAELAVALSRYYILAGGTVTSSPRLLKHLGLVDLLVSARRRDEVAETLVQAIIDNGGKSLTKDQVDALNIEEHPSNLTFKEKEELGWIKDVFSKTDLIQTLHAWSNSRAEIPLSGEGKSFAQSIAQRVADSSYHAVQLADRMISHGFKEFLKGKSLDELARYELENYLERTFRHPYELENYLERTFRHPDAIEGLTAQVERRLPEFNRQFPF